MKKKLVLIIGIAILIILIASVALFLYLKKGKNVEEEKIEEPIDVERLEEEFKELFDNQGNDFVSTLYKIEDEKSGKYKINVNLPFIHIEEIIDEKINREINDIFVNKLLEIINESQKYTILDMDYCSNVNNNKLSLAIRCVLKEGANAQRTIIKTYNYDIENDRLLNMEDIIDYKNLNKGDMQNKVQEEIKKVNSQIKNISEQGYNVYLRDENSEIYKIDNTPDFFLGKNNYLYLVYSYGNNEYTSKIDLVIF